MANECSLQLILDLPYYVGKAKLVVKTVGNLWSGLFRLKCLVEESWLKAICQTGSGHFWHSLARAIWYFNERSQISGVSQLALLASSFYKRQACRMSRPKTPTSTGR